jgi:hypothetical protein
LSKRNVKGPQTAPKTSTHHTKWPQIILSGCKIYQHFPFQGPPKHT